MGGVVDTVLAVHDAAVTIAIEIAYGGAGSGVVARGGHSEAATAANVGGAEAEREKRQAQAFSRVHR